LVSGGASPPAFTFVYQKGSAGGTMDIQHTELLTLSIYFHKEPSSSMEGLVYIS
jgi:hypothetical protein